LSDTERNYKIHNKEMLAVVRYLKAWRHFMKKTVVKFEIWTDHKNLKYFMKVQKLNRRQARWVLYLSQTSFGYISTNSVMIYMVSMAPESP